MDKILAWIPIIGVIIYALTDYNSKSKEMELLELKRKEIEQEIIGLTITKDKLAVESENFVKMLSGSDLDVLCTNIDELINHLDPTL